MPNRAKTAEDYRALAKQRDCKWLGPEVPNTRTKTYWQCPKGHEWPANYSNICNGSGCPECAGLKPKTAKDYLAVAKARGFEWRGPEVPNARTKTYWQCPKGHEWPAFYNSISQGSGCPECAGLKRKTAEDYRVLAKTRGFTWLGPLVPNIMTKTKWRCPKGHEWPASYNNISHGTGCSSCKQTR